MWPWFHSRAAVGALSNSSMTSTRPCSMAFTSGESSKQTTPLLSGVATTYTLGLKPGTKVSDPTVVSRCSWMYSPHHRCSKGRLDLGGVRGAGASAGGQ